MTREPTTAAGRALWAQLNSGLFPPLGAGEHSANLDAILAIEREAVAKGYAAAWDFLAAPWTEVFVERVSFDGEDEAWEAWFGNNENAAIRPNTKVGIGRSATEAVRDLAQDLAALGREPDYD